MKETDTVHIQPYQAIQNMFFNETPLPYPFEMISQSENKPRSRTHEVSKRQKYFGEMNKDPNFLEMIQENERE